MGVSLDPRNVQYARMCAAGVGARAIVLYKLFIGSTFTFFNV